MNTQIGTLHALVEERIQEDTEFQTSIADLPEEEKLQAIETKRAEMREQAFADLAAKAAEKEAEAAKAKEIADNQKKRAEKAESKKETAPEAPSSQSTLGTADLYALLESKVPQEDVSEVQRIAKALNKSITDTLKDPITTGILKQRAEFRKTAAAANVGASRPGAKQVSDAEIITQANNGKVPSKGSDEAERLFWARRGGKR